MVSTYCPRCDGTAHEHPETDASCPSCGAERPVEGWPSDPLIGAAFEGDYRVVRRLGSGGFGVVYLAENREFGAKRALKILHARYVHDDDVLRRFKREAKALYRLQSPYTVRIERWGRSVEGHYYLVMELAEGRTLRTILDEDGALDEARAIAIARQIAVALADAHALDILHRDLKPANIIVRRHLHEGERVVVLDFGISKILSDGTSDNRSGVVGTPIYMAPEVWKPNLGEVDIRADLWSLGLILFEALTGRLPFDTRASSQPLSVAYQACALEPDDVRGPLREAGASEPTVELAVSLLRTSPDDRFQLPGDVLAAIDAAWGGMTRLDAGARTPPTARRPPVDGRRDASPGAFADTAATAHTEADPRLAPPTPDFANEGFTFGDELPHEPAELRRTRTSSGLVLAGLLLLAAVAAAAAYGERVLRWLGGPPDGPDAGLVASDAGEPPPDGPAETLRGAEGATLRFVAGGVFERGADELADAPPAVALLSGFYVDEGAVSRAAWSACVDAARCPTEAASDDACGGGAEVAADPDAPRACVTWAGAEAYCRAQGRRLPWEVEWEAAASAGVIGAVGAEWVADWYASEWYAAAPIDSARGPLFGLERVVRGGVDAEGAPLGAAVRGHMAPTERRAEVGFRCAADVP
jgi:serine/threonine protein kinase/formylglycine-generating enzyme required for sulfatase activity